MLSSRLPSPDTLTLKEQVAQMIVVRTTGHLFDHEVEYPQWEATNAKLQRYLSLGVGGVILLGGSAAEIGIRTQELQSWAKYPLLMAADIEEGVGQRFSGATWFAPPMALGEIAKKDLDLALQLSKRMGAAIAQEAAAIGLNWLLGPVVDVNNNLDNPVINVRAFGEKANVVAKLTGSFIEGTQSRKDSASVLTSAKHFPGHGDTDMDSHLGLPVINHDFERLQALELVPFEQAIASGVDSIMTGHLQLPKVDSTYPSTLSKVMLSGLLRQDMGFGGLIVTDALVMGGITQQYGENEAAVLAVEAGADVVLMPRDVEGAIASICNAVNSGRIPASAILQSVERIWRAKHKIADLMVTDGMSRHAWQHQSVPPVQIEQIATKEARSLAAEILQASQQVNNAPSQSLAQAISPPLIPGQNLVLVDDLLHCRFLDRTAPAIALPASQGYELTLIDSRSANTKNLRTDATTLVQLFIRGNPFRSGRGLSAIAFDLIQALGSNVQAVVLYGSPYVWKDIQALLPNETPCVFTYGQMKMAQVIALQPLLAPNSASNSETTEHIKAAAINSAFTD
ncbi:Glycosyl hydrolase family 3 N terminal domain protein [Synechococcus sp. PCC 7335]|uniref:glycoside hydrolase family 3 N-terminal domain-containing protein n=1 Tax=Synechococcus sp. (strain ATCC 29403 / PCC 7335) TaxID=91464 RepID=UPI00017ED22D|nr:glycoside hydrolase family 3 N-terminal domain-containing protein [Synechococcus sp. PCC 7335]EDX85034.1 Glycosyl hydrolase family 3 N terminal domain protein [Synechococcus sp. PCC 7335]